MAKHQAEHREKKHERSHLQYAIGEAQVVIWKQKKQKHRMKQQMKLYIYEKDVHMNRCYIRIEIVQCQE